MSTPPTAHSSIRTLVYLECHHVFDGHFWASGDDVGDLLRKDFKEGDLGGLDLGLVLEREIREAVDEGGDDVLDVDLGLK